MYPEGFPFHLFNSYFKMVAVHVCSQCWLKRHSKNRNAQYDVAKLIVSVADPGLRGSACFGSISIIVLKCCFNINRERSRLRVRPPSGSARELKHIWHNSFAHVIFMPSRHFVKPFQIPEIKLIIWSAFAISN